MAMREKAARIGQTLSSPRRMVEALQVGNKDPEATKGRFGKWSNKDLDPTPPEQRTWNSWSFFAFQFSIAFSPTTYNVGASLYAIGLNWWTIFIASSKKDY
jgi:NCS1 family nucleobase:cation symporter-1